MTGIGSRGHRRAEVGGRRLRPRSALGRIGLALVLVLFGQLVLLPGTASAANLMVNSTADVATNFGACGNSAQTTSSGSLREAVCAANNAGATSSTITVAAGTYHLTNGELQMGKVGGSNITLTGAGAASTVIDAGGLSRVFNLDPSIVGGVTTSISGVTISGGSDTGAGALGGAGIIAGSSTAATGDHLTVSNSTITNNHTTGLSNVGGGLQFIGGALSITNSTISSNSSSEAPGSGVFYGARGVAAGEGLTVSGSTFSGNTASDSGGGIYNLGVATIQESALSGNMAGSDGGGIFNGASGTLAVKDSTVLNNAAALGADIDNLGILTQDDSTVGVVGP